MKRIFPLTLRLSKGAAAKIDRLLGWESEGLPTVRMFRKSRRHWWPAYRADHSRAAGETSRFARGVEVEQREYPVSIATDDYLAMTEVFTYGRFLRSMLSAAQWHEFRERVVATFHARVGERVEYTGRAHLGVGRKAWSVSRARARLDAMDSLDSA